MESRAASKMSASGLLLPATNASLQVDVKDVYGNVGGDAGDRLEFVEAAANGSS
jgi:hypothetical protein